jgi:hypothetical protein
MTDVSSEIGKFIAPNERGVLEFTDLAKGVYDPAERGLAILSKIANDPAKDTLNKYKHFIVDDLKSSGQIDLNTIGSERRIPFRPRQNFVNDITPGTGRYSLRSAADEVAGEVSAMGREYMTRLDKDLIKRLWQEPVTRKGIIGLGIFAGIGVIHRLTHNPTPEEVGGPPLLPGGSPYEDYDNINYSAVSSMYPSSANFSSGGMQYTVNTSSGYDPQKLSTNLSAITTGSSSTTIYKSRRTVGKRAHSSKDILNSRNSSI